MLTYLFIAIGVAVVTALLLYLDSRLFDRPKKKIIYVKTIAMTVGLVLVTIALLSWISPTKNPTDVIQMGGKSHPRIGGSTTLVPGINEEMLNGPAPF